MNENIKRIWDDAANTNSDDTWQSQVKFMDRFAVLIMNECLDIIDKEVPGMVGVNVMKKIQEHFGVNNERTN